MTNLPTWDVADANNNSAPPAGAPEGMLPGKVNDTIRAIMGALKRMHLDMNGSLTTAGTGNAYTLTTNNTFTSMAQLPIMSITIDRANTDSATLNVDSIGAKSLYKDGALSQFASGELRAGMQLLVLPNVDGDYFEAIGNVSTTLPKGHLFGCELANNATDGDHDIDISAGQAVDGSGIDMMVLTSSLTKQIDAVWAVGSAAGGLDTGTVAADTTYHVWLIKRSDTGVVDALFSTSASSPTMPSNYDLKRRIGCVVTDASANIVDFVQRGDLFRFTSTALSASLNAISAARTYSLLTLDQCPTGVRVRPVVEIYVDANSSPDTLQLDSGDQSSTSPAFTLFYNAKQSIVVSDLYTNTSGQIYLGLTFIDQCIVYCRGWYDDRGKLS